MTNENSGIDLSILESAISSDSADQVDDCAICNSGEACTLHSEPASPTAQLTIRDIMMSAGMDIDRFAEDLGACANCLEDVSEHSIRFGESRYCCDGCAFTGKCSCKATTSIVEPVAALQELPEILDTSEIEIAEAVSQTSAEVGRALTAIEPPWTETNRPQSNPEPVRVEVADRHGIGLTTVTPRHNRYWKYQIDGQWLEARVLAANRFWYVGQ